MLQLIEALLVINGVCDFPETPAKDALTLPLSPWERGPEWLESPSPWGEGLG